MAIGRRRLAGSAGPVALVLVTAAGGACASQVREVERDFVDVRSVPGADVDEPSADDSRLLGPNFSIEIGGVAVVESYSELDPGVTDGDDFRAPDGHELVAAVLTDAQFYDAEMPRLRVQSGEDFERVEEIDIPRAGDIIVVVVPRGEPVRLEVEDAGRAQSIDLRTGERGDDAIEGAYTDVSQAVHHVYTGSGTVQSPELAIDLSPPYPTVALETVPLGVEIEIDEARRRPWATGHGYAPDGRAWLVLSTALRWSSAFHATYACSLTITLEAGTVFSLVDAAGRETPAQPGLLDPVTTTPPDHVVIDVPIDFTTGTLRIDPARSSTCTWLTPPPAGTVVLQLSEQ